MTSKEFHRLKPGTRVQWRENGALDADIGIVTTEGPRRFVQWPDGQQTEESDDWALDRVERSLPPTTAELTGSDPDFTGELSTDEYIRKIRRRE